MEKNQKNKGFNNPTREGYLHKYLSWAGINTPYQFEFYDAPKADWLMRPHGNLVKFNCGIAAKAGESFYILVMIHEFIHLCQQNMGHKSDVMYLKDAFGEFAMRQIDTEADLETFIFFKENYGYDFPKFYTILGEGQSVFGSGKARSHKYERNLSTLLSIYSFEKTNIRRVIMTDLKTLPLDNTLKLFIVGRFHRYDPIYVEPDIQQKILYLLQGKISDPVYFAYEASFIGDKIFHKVFGATLVTKK